VCPTGCGWRSLARTRKAAIENVRQHYRLRCPRNPLAPRRPVPHIEPAPTELAVPVKVEPGDVLAQFATAGTTQSPQAFGPMIREPSEDPAVVQTFDGRRLRLAQDVRAAPTTAWSLRVNDQVVPCPWCGEQRIFFRMAQHAKAAHRLPAGAWHRGLPEYDATRREAVRSRASSRPRNQMEGRSTLYP
jgi:hypothetical protein